MYEREPATISMVRRNLCGFGAQLCRHYLFPKVDTEGDLTGDLTRIKLFIKPSG